jgi:hypothetical protein
MMIKTIISKTGRGGEEVVWNEKMEEKNKEVKKRTTSGKGLGEEE